MSAVNNRSRNTTAKAEVEAARSTGKLTTLASKAEVAKVRDANTIEADGVRLVCTPFLDDGRSRVNGSACLVYVGASKSAAKGLGIVALTAVAIHADDVAAKLETLDKQHKLGAFAPAKPERVKSDSAADALAAENAELKAQIAAILAKLG
jgi:hypothetical protein